MNFEKKLQYIDELQKQIDSFGDFSTEVKKKINYKFRIDWNYYSNAMEGNTLTMEETRSVMIGNITVNGKPIKDLLEMQGHDKIINDILKIGKGEIRLSEKRIKDIHIGIMHEDDPEKAKQIGHWKTQNNHVINYKLEKYEFVPTHEVAEKIHTLLNWTNAVLDNNDKQTPNAYHPLKLALEFHLNYVTIHPFYDGNGRTARILMNLLLISQGYPPIIIKTEDKEIYYRYLGDVQAYGGNPDLFFSFMADLMIRSQQLVLDALQGKDISTANDIDKQLTLLNKMLDGLDGLDGEISVTRSEETLNNLLDEVLFPIMRKVDERLLKITPLFIDSRLAFYVNRAGTEASNIDELIESTSASWLNLKGNIDNAYLSVYLKKLRKLGTRAFDLQAEINFNFYQHMFQIIFHDRKIERLYHQRLTNEELDQLATQFVQEIVVKIEERVKQLSSK